MSAWEIVLLVAVCIAFAVAVGVIIYNKIKGKGGCDCCRSADTKSFGGCDGCCEHCARAKDRGATDNREKK